MTGLNRTSAQITGKNGAELINYVKNRFCGRAGVRALAGGTRNQHFNEFLK